MRFATIRTLLKNIVLDSMFGVASNIGVLARQHVTGYDNADQENWHGDAGMSGIEL